MQPILSTQRSIKRFLAEIRNVYNLLIFRKVALKNHVRMLGCAKESASHPAAPVIPP